ncbi:MAG: efflux RND transporter permease subunit, partial [Desulfobacterales bacterium]|nr:efflux RND transporter permease subunit [Desulfobacterales bacterium]
MKQVLAAFARNRVFANVVLCMILFAGALAAMCMVREDLPQMAEDAISIHVAWPGADPGEVEEGICRKIEEAVKGVEGVKKCGSTARDNGGGAWLEVKEGYDPNLVLERVRNRVNAISTFPGDAEKPIIIRPQHREAVMGLYLQADMNEHRLKEWAHGIEDEMRRDLGVSHVQLVGARNYEINIEVSEERLRQFGLTLSRVADAVRKSNLNLSGGAIHSR